MPLAGHTTIIIIHLFCLMHPNPNESIDQLAAEAAWLAVLKFRCFKITMTDYLSTCKYILIYHLLHTYTYEYYVVTS